MKKILCFSLAIFILTISILIYCPISAFASYPDDYYSLSKPYNQGLGLSSADAQAAVNAHKDIADSRGILCFQYTPTEKYNWTVNTKITQNIHLSDNQLKQLLMSKHAISAGFLNFMYGTVNSNAFRGFISGVGVATRTDSDTLLGIADKITGNYNYLDAIDYNEDTQTIVMSNDNSSVDKLREEIKEYYYESLGVCLIKSSGKPSDGVYQIRSAYDDIDEYNHDLTAANDFDYAFFTSTTDVSDAYTLAMFNKKDISYLYAQIDTSSYFSHCYSLMFSDDGVSSFYLFSKMKYFYNYYNTADLGDYYSNYYYTQDSFVGYGIDMRNLPYISSIYPCYIKGKDYANNPTATRIYKLYRHSDYFSSAFYSKDGSPLVVFKSQSALYNYIQGDQSAYLSKTINNIGEDITFSIKDMNENLGSKMDTLIDTINDKKGSMSADELQNAIDKGLEDLNKTSEDIKDNTEEMNSKLDSVLEALNAQNQTLLEILGVTKKIADTVDDINEKTDYNSIISTISTIFNAVQCALLYGQNTLKDSDSSAQAQAVSYSDDDIAVYSDSGGTYKPKVLNMDLRSGIFGHFPFSMIYHMYDWCAAFVAEAKAPIFTYNYGFLVGDKDNPELTVSIDLSQYEDWRDVAASFMRLAFTLAVAFGSYKRFKEEML